MGGGDMRGNIVKDKSFNHIHNDAVEIIKLLTTILKTSKSNATS